MLGIPLRYLFKHPLAAVDLVSDPLQVLTNIRDVYVAQQEQRRPQCNYESTAEWERCLHSHLGVPWPCQLTSEFWDVWSDVMKELEARGIHAGPESFGS